MTAAALPSFACNTDRSGVPLVFVPGIKGSALAAPGGRLHWLGAAAVLGLSRPRLDLPLHWSGARQDSDGLRATGPLAAVRFLPGLESPVYAPWLRRAAALGRPFYGFAYDWRRDNLETLDALRRCVAAIRARHGAGQVEVVAHSLGGLIAWALVNERPQWFAHALFAGVPFRGGIGFLADMHRGVPTGLNGRITSPRMWFSCPSVYAFYPSDRSDCIEARGQPLALDFYDAASWVRQGLGIFASPAQATPEHVAFLRRALQQAARFRALLQPRAARWPRITNVIAGSTPTLGIAIKQGPRSVRGWDLDSAPRECGDGRVCLRNAKLPGGVPGTEVEVDRGHSGLLDSPEIAERLIPAR
jgi:pimeloyl-ACP methyl ester carboxylesterase